MNAIKRHEEKVNNLQSELARLKISAATPNSPDFRVFSSSSRECERRLDRAEHQLSLHEIQLSEQDMQIQMLEATSYNGTYILENRPLQSTISRRYRFIALRSTLDGLDTKFVPVCTQMGMVLAKERTCQCSLWL